MADISIVINPAETISANIAPSDSISVGTVISYPPHASTHAPGSYDSLSSYYALTGDLTGYVGKNQTGYLSGVFYPYSANPAGYVQGAVVRPSNTGNFVDKAGTGSLTGVFYPLNSNPSGYVTGSVVRPSQTGNFVVTGQTGSFITSSQTGQFYPITNPSGYVTGSVVRPSETGSLTEAFYPLNENPAGYLNALPPMPAYLTYDEATGYFYPLDANPSGYTTGSVVRPSETGVFVTTGSTGNFVTGSVVRPSQTGNFVVTGQTGNFITSSQTGQFYPISNPSGYVTGSVVRPNETGIFVTTGSTGNFVTGTVVRPSETGYLTGAFYPLNENPAGYLTSIPPPPPGEQYLTYDEATGYFYPLDSNPSGYVTGSVVRPSETGNFITTSQTGQFVGTGATGSFAVNSQVVFITGNQNVSGVKNFYSRPTVDGTGILLSGEAAVLPTTILYTTGNQIKSGRLIIGDTIVDTSHPYTLSLQSNNQDTFLEILNSGGAGKGVFFGINNNDFEQYNWQGGDIVFFTAETSEAGYARLIIKNDGKVGIGTNSPSEKLDVSGDIKANSATFNTRPTINGTGVLLSGEAVSAANTGSLTGVFYPLNANPSGYITGSVVRPSETGVFVTTGSTGSFVVTTQTGAFLTTGAADNRYYGIVSTGEIYIDAGAMLTGVSGATSTGIAFVNSGLSSDAYNFDAATNQYSLFKMAIPDNWNKGTIKSKFYWTASGGSGNVVWGMQAAAFSNDDPIDGSWGTAQEVTGSFITGNDLHISAATSSITISNSPASNDLIMFRTYRNAAAAGDTYSLGANLLGVKIQYTISGSITSW
jgi:hypothetical protein